MQLLRHAIELFIKHVFPKLRPPHLPRVELEFKYSSILEISITLRVYNDKGYLAPSKDKILLLSDTKNAIAIRLDKNGRVTKRSFLSYRQDESVCEFACHLKITNLDYLIENKIKYDSTFDHETMIRNYIVDNIKKSTDEDKAKYVYYLFFNRISDYSKDKLLESVKSEDYEKCQKIYDFLIQN